MPRIFFALILLFVVEASFAQYDAECFINSKKEVKFAVENQPLDSIAFKDTLIIDGVKRYVDTVRKYYKVDPELYVQKMVGCRMPDFTFFNLEGTDLSINKIRTDFSIVSFSSTTYGDICNARLQQFCKLKSFLKDSISVINIFEEKDNEVLTYSKDYGSNVEYVANADLLFYHYNLQFGPTVYLLDKYKNIIWIKVGHRYKYTPDEIYLEILEKIRSTYCAD